MIKHVLVVDNDPLQCDISRLAIQKLYDAHVTSLYSGEEAIAYLMSADSQSVDAVLLDLVMPGVDGMQVLRAVKPVRPMLPIIIHTAHGHVDAAVQAISEGAIDFIEKQEGDERLEAALNNAERITQLQRRVADLESSQKPLSNGFDDIVGKSKAIREAKKLAIQATKSDVPVCIQGESGVGKAMFARAIHQGSSRAASPFVLINCGAIAANQQAELLFGNKGQTGRLAEADGGVLFLEEVDKLIPEVQVRLNRFMQDGVFEMQHGQQQAIDVRFFAATNQRLRDAVEQGSFREDLYYQLNVFQLYVPSLRERTEDITRLLDHFVSEVSAKEGKTLRGVEKDVKRDLCNYEWPGNVRQLYNAVQRAVVMSRGNWLTWQDFSHVSQALSSWKSELDGELANQTDQWCSVPLVDQSGEFCNMAEIEREVIHQALSFHGWNISKTSKALDIGRSTLYRKMTEYGIEEPIVRKESA